MNAVMALIAFLIGLVTGAIPWLGFFVYTSYFPGWVPSADDIIWLCVFTLVLFCSATAAFWPAQTA